MEAKQNPKPTTKELRQAFCKQVRTERTQEAMSTPEFKLYVQRVAALIKT